MTDIEFRISAQYHDAITVSQYEDDKVWLATYVRGGHTYTTLTLDQARQLIEALSKVVEAQE